MQDWLPCTCRRYHLSIFAVPYVPHIQFHCIALHSIAFDWHIFHFISFRFVSAGWYRLSAGGYHIHSGVANHWYGVAAGHWKSLALAPGADCRSSRIPAGDVTFLSRVSQIHFTRQGQRDRSSTRSVCSLPAVVNFEVINTNLMFSVDLAERIAGSARWNGWNARRIRSHETGAQNDTEGNVDQFLSARSVDHCCHDDVGPATLRNQRCNHSLNTSISSLPNQIHQYIYKSIHF